MLQPRPFFYNKQIGVIWTFQNIYYSPNQKFSLQNIEKSENLEQNENNQYSIINKLTYEFNLEAEKLFWRYQLQDKIKIFIFNELIDLDFKQAIEQLSKNKVVSYYFKAKQHFEKQFYEHIEFLLISFKNIIIYNFKNKTIESTLQSKDLNLFLNIFIKEQSIIDTFKTITQEAQFLNRLISKNKNLPNYKQQNLQNPQFKIDDGTKTIIWTIDQIGLNYYLCFEPNFITYYGQLNDKQQKHGRGILFQTTWDDSNPNFIILQGSFKNGKKNGLMIKFNSRSENILYGQEYIDDQFIKQVDLDDNGKVKVVEIKPPEIQQQTTQEPPKKRRIIIMEEGVMVNNIDKPIKENQIVKSNLFVKFNQQYNDNDEKILNSRRGQWLTSSIIDGYALYLQKQYYQEVFQNDNPIQQLKTFIIDSTYLTNAEIDYKIVYALRALCYEFKGISIFDIFENIAVIVNQRNTHWFLVVVKREKQNGKDKLNFHVSDSMSGNKQKYIQVCEKIFNLLTYHLELEVIAFQGEQNIIVENVLQQKDGYSCGDHTCFFLQQYFQEDGQQQQNKVQVQDMRKILFNLIFSK
ncbi:unnamed protein product [Paramecium sonneborni]|uniref:Ubiquitin-like protease family profile domain-containing protein n=1 Tax=Paramecium sonneborni TaxID=65129 RepID=A0A8S1Q7T7_9CILI|nr:unnamed protein product [Paramecium sonneborni]